VATDRVAADRVTADRVTADRVIADRVIADRVIADRVIACRPRRAARAADGGITEPRTRDEREPVLVEPAGRRHEAAGRSLG
jgi:hypothetical protein